MKLTAPDPNNDGTEQLQDDDSPDGSAQKSPEQILTYATGMKPPLDASTQTNREGLTATSTAGTDPQVGGPHGGREKVGAGWGM